MASVAIGDVAAESMNVGVRGGPGLAAEGGGKSSLTLPVP